MIFTKSDSYSYSSRNILFLILIAFAITTSSCSQNKKEDSNKETTDFQKYTQQLPILENGFSIDCSTNLTHFNLENKFIPEGAAVIGRIQEIDTAHSFVIYSYPADIRLPILEVYNSNGKKINQVTLLDLSLCNSDTPISQSEFELLNDKEIILRERKIENNSILKSSIVKLSDLIID